MPPGTFRKSEMSRTGPVSAAPVGTLPDSGSGPLSASLNAKKAPTTLAATTASAAICGQRSFWKYVSTAIAMATTSAAMKTSTPSVPALYVLRATKARKPPKKTRNA